MKIEVVSLSLILFAYHIFYDDHQLFYIDGSNGFGDDEDLESESSTIPYVENDIDIDDEYFSFWRPTLSSKWNKNWIRKKNKHFISQIL